MRWENPIFIQASRQRMRGGRTYGCLLVYLGVLSAVVLIAYNELVNSRTVASGIAQTLFDILTIAQWTLVALLAPGLTVSSITLEREQRTYDLLILTPLSRFSIVWGKFLSAVAFLGVLVACGIPLVAILLLLGGVDFKAFILRYLLMLATGAVLAAFGLMVSAICATSLLASLLTYGVALYVYFLGFLGGFVWVVSRAFGGSSILSVLQVTTVTQSWVVWLLAGAAVVLIVVLFLQIAANYLLTDPRTGAWKTRVWITALFIVILGEAIALSRSPLPLTHNFSALVAAGMLSMVLPPIATGVPLGGRRWKEWLSWRSLKEGSVQSGLLFAGLLFVLAVAAEPLYPPTQRSSVLAWLCLGGYIWWIWALGYFISWQVRNRWGAIAILIGLMYLFSSIAPAAFGMVRWQHVMQVANLSFPSLLFANGMGTPLVWTGIYLLLGTLMVLLEEALTWRKQKRLAGGSR